MATRYPLVFFRIATNRRFRRFGDLSYTNMAKAAVDRHSVLPFQQVMPRPLAQNKTAETYLYSNSP